MVHSPESAIHISTLLSVKGTRSSGILVEWELDSDGDRMSSGTWIEDLCRIEASVGVSSA